MENIKLRTNTTLSKTEPAKNQGFSVGLTSRKNLLPEDYTEFTASQYIQYLSERQECGKIRLTCQINPFCTNILFNAVSEIVRHESNGEISLANLSPITANGNTLGKNVNFEWTQSALIKDTQLSSPKSDNLEYRCGLDIFNNHILRSKTYIPSYRTYSSSDAWDEYNTITDVIRDANGWKTKYGNVTTIPSELSTVIGSEKITGSPSNYYYHIYNKNNSYTIDDAIDNRLLDVNGWLGFYNRSCMINYDSSNSFDISRVINNKNHNDFISMYPGISEYSFIPQYNKYMKRYEKNWNYCLTYPFSATTNVNFIDSETGYMKVSFIDENLNDDDGILKTVIYSTAKHGLEEGDAVNVYKKYSSSGKNVVELSIQNGIVSDIIDEYTFMLHTEKQLCGNWISIYDNSRVSAMTVIEEATAYELSGKTYYALNEYINADDTAQEILYTKVNGGVESRYYVRLFRRVPNYKMSDKKVDELSLYENGMELLKQCSTKENEFSSSISKMSFAKTAYNDDISEIVFTDDIDIRYLRDNLGRPISSCYLTIIKNNAGYKEWYNENKINDSSIEISHCFGKLNAGIEMGEYSHFNEKFRTGNVFSMNNVSGISVGGITIYGNLTDEITYDDDVFLGDVCMYESSLAMETVLQPVMYRFNTAQRECGKAIYNYFSYDKIITDDNDSEGFSTAKIPFGTNLSNKPEGYYYQPNYKIQVRDVSSVMESAEPEKFTILSMKNDGAYLLEFITLETNYMKNGELFFLYDNYMQKYFNCTVKSIKNYTTFTAEIRDESNSLFGSFTNDIGYAVNGDSESINIEDISRYTIAKRPLSVPNYASISKDGSFMFVWRGIMQNGFDSNTANNEEYPFLNGAIYINKNINLYLRRQDPDGNYNLKDSYSTARVLNGNVSSNKTIINNGLNENNITC